MANSLWGNVYYKDIFAGRLEENPDRRCVFTYDETYLNQRGMAISYTMPLQKEPYISESGLHPFFDNLVAEGWFKNAQARALGVNPNHRFALLLGFGHDLAGAVSVIDPEPQKRDSLDHLDKVTQACLSGRASLSGVQRKLLVVKDQNSFRPVGPDELSTHIAKLTSSQHNELLELEFLTTEAVRILLPDDETVKTEIIDLSFIQEKALIIPRFDRTTTGKRLFHFEEFNQLFGKYSGDSNDKYEGGYEDMGQFILKTDRCIPAEADRLLKRIFVCFLAGNTDAHFKNFAMFHTNDGLRLTPAYDLVASSIYPEYQSIALHVCGIQNLPIGKLEAKHLIRMSKGFAASDESLMMIAEALEKRLPLALEAVERSEVGSHTLKTKIQERMEKRWNGSFKLIGQRLSKKQNKGANSKT